MKTENSSPTTENTASKQAWSEPVLVMLSVSLETSADVIAGGDGGLTMT